MTLRFLLPSIVHGCLVAMAVFGPQHFLTLASAQQPPVVSASRPSLSGAAETGFEATAAGAFQTLKTEVGVWTTRVGSAVVDHTHAKTGKQCLHLPGPKSVVELEITEGIGKDGRLTFSAERWTSRNPFSFRIEKQTNGRWSEIFNGDGQVRVGRSFLSNIKLALGDSEIDRLRFSVESPANTGILIDDVRISPAQPQKIVSVESVPLTLPALVRAKSCALVKLKIETVGDLKPISVREVAATLTETTDVSDIESVLLIGSGENANFSPTHQPVIEKTIEDSGGEIRLPCPSSSCQLSEGSNYVWIACRLKPSANIDRQIAALCQRITFSNGETIDVDSKPFSQRLGVSLRTGGDDGVHTYRIPGLATTNKGTLIGVYDVRRRGGGDLPGDIDVGMSRSTDGGRTWDPMKIIMDMGNDPKWRHDGIGDPAVLVDRNTGTIWVAATWSHGNRSWIGSGPGLTPEETGQLMLVRSDDDGVTWSKPINITEQIKRPEWCFILQGPGKGITMRDGTIVFAAQYQDPPDKRRLPHSTIIYSKDHGKTWQVGTGAFDDTTEAQVVESQPGVLMLNCRYNRKAARVVMTTRDMGKTWQKHETSERSLIEPGSCMASLIDVDNEVGRNVGNWLLFSNPDSTRGRHHITIKASPDRGMTWPKQHRLLLDEQISAGYSCMSMIDNRTIGILYEGSQAHMTFQRIPLSDLVGTTQPQKSVRYNATRPLDIFVLTGQSNSLGTVNPADSRNPKPPASKLDADVPFFWSNRSTRSGDGPAVLIGSSSGKFASLQPQQGEGNHPVFWGPEFGFARKLASAGHKDFAIIKASRGGGGNSFWLKGSSDDHMYQHVLSTVSEAVRVIPHDREFRIRAICYLQGESDNQAEAAAAGDRLKTLLSNLRKDLPNASDARLIVGGIATHGARRDVVRREHSAAAKSDGGIDYIDNHDLQHQLYDGLHFDKQAKLTVGQRMAQQWLDFSAKPPVSISLPRVFGDHMVLQADAPLPVWGKANPDSQLSLQLGDERLTTTADRNGDWAVRFSARQATAVPTELSIQSENDRLNLTNILFGEVWVCAGQSNMEWMLSESTNGKVELASANHPNLRLLHLVGGARGRSPVYTTEDLSRLTPETFCEGQWQVASQQSARNFSAVAWYFGRQLQEELKIPIGLICPAVGGTPAEAWIPEQALKADPELNGLVAGNWLDNPRLSEFCRTRGHQNLLAAIQAGESFPGDEFGPNHAFKPGFMWQAAVKPLIPYAIRGVIWYQGESNAETPARVREYGHLFPLLIDQWRKQWNQDDFPFLYVQLPALNRPEWPWFRDGQRRSLDQLTNVGMAVTIDTGHPSNVHPTLKKPIGQRLAKWALGTTYQLHPHTTYSGPLLNSVKRQGNSLIVTFNHVGDGLKSSDNKPLRYFDICGRDGVFHSANAGVIGSNTIVVSSPKVAEPNDVRYAWLAYPNPAVNLFNSDDLPASPFSTESSEDVFARRVAASQHPHILFTASEDNGHHP